VFNKPVGWTSHDVVQWTRRRLGLKRVGHLGTLDPMATGVLPVCVGRATRLIEYFPEGKAYEAEVLFGVTTDTLDITGVVQDTPPTDGVTEAALRAVLPTFVGTLRQRVPLYSAVHVNGQKLYRFAQKGLPVAEDQLPVREVRIDALDLLTWGRNVDGHPVARIRVQCGGGTYIRSLARDLGEALGSGACLSALCRTVHGRISLTSTITPGDDVTRDTLLAHLQPALAFLDDESRWTPTTSDTLRRLVQGMPVSLAEGHLANAATPHGNERLLVLTPDGHLAAVAEWRDEKVRPLKVLLTADQLPQ
jgi:tRNA pseudouridine55 synthase